MINLERRWTKILAGGWIISSIRKPEVGQQQIQNARTSPTALVRRGRTRPGGETPGVCREHTQTSLVKHCTNPQMGETNLHVDPTPHHVF